MTNFSFNQSKQRREISLQEDSFTPCKHQISLLEPLTDAAENAALRATILLSPALSSLDGFQTPGIPVKNFIE
jgi:hypothetical protein